MFVILGRDAMSDCEEGLTEYLKGVWLKIRPGLSVMLLMNFLYVMIVLLKHWKND